MFHTMRNNQIYGTLFQEALQQLRQRLPPGWRAEETGELPSAALQLSGPDGSQAKLPVIARKSMQPRDALVVIAEQKTPAIVVSAYIGERSQQLLGAAGLSYADATGNLRIVASRPAIFIQGMGAQQNPQRVRRPLQSLRGAAAGRVVRALAECTLPKGVRELSADSETPLGTVSRVVTLLEDEALLTRDAKRTIVSVDIPAMLLRWAQDYELTQSNELYSYLEPRGLSVLWPKLERLQRYAATGSTAGPGIAPTRLAMLYVDEPLQAAELLNLVPTESGANVWLLRPFDEVVYTRTRQRAGATPESPAVNTVSAAQAVVDLLSSPGRGPQEAMALLESLRENRDVP